MKKPDKGSTVFLRLAIVALGIFAAVLAFIVLPAIARDWAHQYPDVAWLRLPVLIGAGFTIVPFYSALVQTIKLLNLIDKNEAFSEKSIKSLTIIKYSAVVFGMMYALAMPLIYHVAQVNDAPGLILIGSALAGGAVTVAVFAAVLQRLLQNAIDLKAENDLTV